MPGENAPVEVASGSGDEVRSAYDRIANPDKVQEPKPAPVVDQPKVEIEEPTAEVPPEPAYTNDQIKDVIAQVSRIPELEKQLRDAGGRYGALKQSLEQLQQKISAPATGEPIDVEEMLKEIKDDFGEEGLYKSLKAAFSKVVAGKSIDPETVGKIVLERIEETKKAEEAAAIAELTDAHPTWMEDRKTPEFKEWMSSLPEKQRKRFERSNDPYYVADVLDGFAEWKKKKVAPTPAPVPTPAPAKAEEPEHVPSKRLTNAVMPTNGTKPKAKGEDDKASQVRAAYEKVAGARMR